MGWCSATEIMDAAVSAADAAVRAILDEYAPPLKPEVDQAKVDEVLRPFVASIAAKLRDGDWDCIEEADAFDRFRQEMLGKDHRQMVQWYREQLEDIEDPRLHVEYGQLMIKHLEEADSGR